MTATLAEGMMKERGLSHVPIPQQPGYQLYVADQRCAEPLQRKLLELFQSRSGWWIGALDDALTLRKATGKSATRSRLVPEADLDTFVAEGIELERALWQAISTV
jgi:hypothetical protein